MRQDHLVHILEVVRDFAQNQPPDKLAPIH
jgi:hypothetical protein